MKPGDLVTIRKVHLSLKLPIAYLDVYERIDGEEDINVIWKWEHGEVGILMEGRDEVQEMAQVLHKGRVGWVDEEYLRVVDESPK